MEDIEISLAKHRGSWKHTWSLKVLPIVVVDFFIGGAASQAWQKLLVVAHMQWWCQLVADLGRRWKGVHLLTTLEVVILMQMPLGERKIAVVFCRFGPNRLVHRCMGISWLRKSPCLSFVSAILEYETPVAGWRQLERYQGDWLHLL